MRLKVRAEDSLSLIACAGIGMLQAIRDGKLSTTAGIATLGRPRSWEALVQQGGLAKEIGDVFQSFDELAALEKLSPGAVHECIAALIVRLESALGKLDSPSWEVTWDGATASRRSRT